MGQGRTYALTFGLLPGQQTPGSQSPFVMDGAVEGCTIVTASPSCVEIGPSLRDKEYPLR